MLLKAICSSFYLYSYFKNMRISGGLFNIIGVLMQDNSDGNDTGYMGQNYDEGPSTSSKFKSKLRDLRRR
jgi:hypothetical protein